MSPPSSQSPFAVARYFLERAEGDRTRDVTPMKLIKLAYIAHGWVLCFTDEPLLAGRVQAWKYGPVVPSLYTQFNRFGDSPIPSGESTILPEFRADDRTTATLDGVWAAYRELTGVQLSALTHKPGTPWHETWYRLGGKDTRGAVIDNLLIRDHYAELLDRSEVGSRGAVLAGA